MMLRSKKRHQKAFKRSPRNKNVKVLTVKPYPIPDLEGQAASDFEQQIREPPTEVQKRMIKESKVVFAQVKRRK